MKHKRFEVTQFQPVKLGAKWFVKLHSERFTQSELCALQNLRLHLNRKFPQRKNQRGPRVQWRLSVETCNDAMTGWLDITLPDRREIEWAYFGTTEEVCTKLGNSLDANL